MNTKPLQDTIQHFLKHAKIQNKFFPWACYSSVGDTLFVYLEDKPSITTRSLTSDNVDDMVGLDDAKNIAASNAYVVESPIAGLKIHGIKRKGLKGYYTLREIIQLCVTNRAGYIELCEKADSNILDQLVKIS